MNKIAPLICILLGLYWLWMGISRFGLWVFHGPGGGLFPAVAGLVLFICGSITLYRNIKNKVRFPFEARPFILTGAALLTVLSTYLLGLLIPLGLFIFGWLKFMEKRPLLQSFLIGAITVFILYLIFQVLLRVPLPRGLIFNMLR